MAGTLFNYSNIRDLLITTNNSECIFFEIYKIAKHILRFFCSKRSAAADNNNRVTSHGQNWLFFPKSAIFHNQNIFLTTKYLVTL
jgi:hypothetical protein